MTNYLIKYATSKSMRINHNICNNARMRKRNRSRMRKKIGHAELLSNGATARYTQEPSQKKRPQIQTIKNIWRTNRNQPQTTNIPHLTSIQTKNTKKTKKKKTHIWEHTYTKLLTHVKDNVFGRMIAREFCKYILTNSNNYNNTFQWEFLSQTFFFSVNHGKINNVRWKYQENECKLTSKSLCLMIHLWICSIHTWYYMLTNYHFLLIICNKQCREFAKKILLINFS